VPDPVALPEPSSDGHHGVEPEPVRVSESAREPEPVGAAPDRTAAALVAVPPARPTEVGAPDDARRPAPRRRPQQGQVVPLRPRATTRLKATGELLILVALLGVVVSSLIVAAAVAGNHVLSGL